MIEEIIHYENNNTKNLKVSKMPSGYLDRKIYIYFTYLGGQYYSYNPPRT